MAGAIVRAIFRPKILNSKSYVTKLSFSHRKSLELGFLDKGRDIVHLITQSDVSSRFEKKT
jgi:hypothetical protein